jgi:hypothetical protein
MCADIERTTQKEIFSLLSKGLLFHGFIATSDVRAYELSEKGYRIHAASRADFTRQAYEADDSLRADNMTFRTRYYWRIKNGR